MGNGIDILSFWISNNNEKKNCYYFALILADRFDGDIYYDVINGHFITKIQDNFYDWNGIVNTNNCLVEWNKMDQYDSLVKQRIIRDCIH